jgi:hypothetical protein
VATAVLDDVNRMLDPRPQARLEPRDALGDDLELPLSHGLDLTALGGDLPLDLAPPMLRARFSTPL